MKSTWPTLFYLAPLFLVGCISTVLNPTVVGVMPGPNKSPQAFAADQAACKQFADQQIAEARNQTLEELTEQMKQEGEGGPVVPDSAVTGAIAALQQPYNAAYSQCMFAKGNQVPGFQVATPEPPHRRPVHRRARRAAPQGQGAAEQQFVEPPPSVQPASDKIAEPPPVKR